MQETIRINSDRVDGCCSEADVCFYTVIEDKITAQFC